jgi:predicted XRE-type DNA-binding protein
MKNYTEAKDLKELGKILKVPAAEAAKIEMRTNIVIAIKKCIEKQKLTHVQAAKRADVGRTVITALMNGNTTHVSTDRLIDIAQNLGLTVTLKIA